MDGTPSVAGVVGREIELGAGWREDLDSEWNPEAESLWPE